MAAAIVCGAVMVADRAVNTTSRGWFPWRIIVAVVGVSPAYDFGADMPHSNSGCSGSNCGVGEDRVSGGSVCLRKQRSAGCGNLLDVAVVGAAAAAQHVQARCPLLDRGVLSAELGRVAVVEVGRLVELRVTLP